MTGETVYLIMFGSLCLLGALGLFYLIKNTKKEIDELLNLVEELLNTRPPFENKHYD